VVWHVSKSYLETYEIYKTCQGKDREITDMTGIAAKGC